VSNEKIVPIHQWTNGGAEVLVVRFCDRDGKSRNRYHPDGFPYPTKTGDSVEAPDWHTRSECGGGLHGWPWGMCIGEGKDSDWGALWQVYGVAVEDIIDLTGKVKFRRGVLRFSGDWHAAMLFVLDGQMAWVKEAASGASSATGYSGASSATGYSGASSATGDSGASSATGDSGASSATGYSGASSATGKCSASAVTGLDGRVRGGEFGCIALAWWNEKKERAEMRCTTDYEANVWYVLDKLGKFVKDKSQD
jgi:hypothetical protein